MHAVKLTEEINFRQKSLRILLVDDEPGIRDLCKIFLESREYEVDLASDGLDAVACLKEKRYDLIVTDNRMPGLTGIELVRQLRAVGNEVPAILISGNLDVGDPDLHSLFNSRERLEKPFSMAQLLSAVEETLRRSQMQNAQYATCS